MRKWLRYVALHLPTNGGLIKRRCCLHRADLTCLNVSSPNFTTSQLATTLHTNCGFTIPKRAQIVRSESHERAKTASYQRKRAIMTNKKRAAPTAKQPNKVSFSRQSRI